MPRPPVFIEKIMPVKLLNQQVYDENGGNPFKGLHRWYSRKPLSFSRASVLGSILPAEISMEEFEYLLGLYSEAELNLWQNSNLSEEDKENLRSKNKTKLYKTPPTDKQIQRVQELCSKIWGTPTPAILDQFAGGGSIPFEGVRYGLNVYASDLNPVAVVTMKAAIAYPLKFGSGLQEDIDRWVKWVGDEAQKRLSQFFPGGEGETIQNYLWAHTVICPSCEAVIPLSPNWWLSKTSNYAGKGKERKVTQDWYAVKPIPIPEAKRVDFELVRGKKGKDTTIETDQGDYDPNIYNTISRGVGKCLCCDSVVEDGVIKAQAQNGGLGHQLYAVAFKRGKESLSFRIPTELDLEGVAKAERYLEENREELSLNQLIPDAEISLGEKTRELIRYGIDQWYKLFNPRQLLTLVTYLQILNEAKTQLQSEYEPEKVEAICSYLSLVMDRCVDENCRLTHWNAARGGSRRASAQHSLNLMWNYPETTGYKELWDSFASECSSNYHQLCSYFNPQTLPTTTPLLTPSNSNPVTQQIHLESADSLYHIPDQTIDAIITDPPYYGTIQYAELSDFFYVWQKRILGDIFPNLFWQELTDKDREAVANPSRFRNMGESPEKLAQQDYEAKMSLAWQEAYRVLRDEGVLTVQFNHKESGAWDTLAKALIDAGFEITASWAVATENPQNLHQAKKNSVSSTVILVCRKRDPNAPPAWWDDLRPEVANLVEKRAPEFEANNITGIDLYLSAFGPALNVFSRSYPILDNSGLEVRPEVAFTEARKAIANYRFYKLVQSDTLGFDALTQWYLLAWDAFKAREFAFDEARQLALAIGGFNITDLAKNQKLIDLKSGSCTLLTPQQRLKKRGFTTNPQQFNSTYLIDALHAVIAIYEEEKNLQSVRQFMQKTGLQNNDTLMKTLEVAFKVIPDQIKEKQSLINIWLGIDEVKAKVTYYQGSLELRIEN